MSNNYLACKQYDEKFQELIDHIANKCKHSYYRKVPSFGKWGPVTFFYPVLIENVKNRSTLIWLTFICIEKYFLTRKESSMLKIEYSENKLTNVYKNNITIGKRNNSSNNLIKHNNHGEYMYVKISVIARID